MKTILARWLEGREQWPERFAGLAAEAPPGPLKAFYDAGIPESDRPLGDTPLISIDLETTGLDPDRDSIVSIGLITLDLERIYCRDARHWIFKPERSLSSTSVTIHAITHSDVDRSPGLESRFEEILDWLAGRVAVAHFAPIERRFLERAARDIYNYPLLFPIIDTMDLERRHYQSGWRGLFSKVDSLRLDACRNRLKLPRYKAHHALTDALATAELLQAQIAHRYKPDDPVSKFWD
ncbi:MAG TPA: 3'-5' exonuclease [Arenicellales bacterium]|nr:3'-5' exonuclease [Arenicellales bacterium]